MTTNLFSTGFQARPDFSTVQIGDLVTVNVYNPQTEGFDLQSGARVNRIDCGNVWVTLVGLEVSEPYKIGDRLVIDQDKVIDW